MNHAMWEAYLSISRKIETGGRNADVTADAGTTEQPHHRAFVAKLLEFLPSTLPDGSAAKVLSPGSMEEALVLARAGYEVHALLLGPDNVRWLQEQARNVPGPGSVVVLEEDAHDLSRYRPAHFDGYFSSQFHEHLLAPMIHIGEVRRVSKVGAKVFVDACGVTEPAFRIPWHTNMVPEAIVFDQWEFWGFAERWRGDRGDAQPQFVFEMLPDNHPAHRHAGYLAWCHRLRAGEQIAYDYHCAECGRP